MVQTLTDRRVRPNNYHYFVSVNTQRGELGLPQFDLSPAEPVFSPNPVAELVVTNTSGKITFKLGVPSPAAEYTLGKPGYGHPSSHPEFFGPRGGWENRRGRELVRRSFDSGGEVT